MKKVTFVLVCFAMLALSSVAAFASDGNSPLRATIPFAFNVQNVSYDSGTYTLYVENGFLHVRNEADKSEKAFLALPADSANVAAGSALRFTDVNGKKYLTKVWGSGRQSSVEFMHSSKASEQIASAEGSR